MEGHRVPDKSKNDYRDYRVIDLSNGLKTLLISDIRPTSLNQDGTQLAAAALCVNIGSFSDPDQVQGLAHFLEHMLFMGSEKYPDENDYDTFIKSHGGSDNAYTGHDRTVYQFDIQPEHFEGALDRFSQLLTSPLLRENAVEREVKAVDSEFKQCLPHDTSRLSQLMAHISRKDHAFSKFSWGNRLSLVELPKRNGIDVMLYLKNFFEEYSKQYMTLVLIAPETLDKLERFAHEYFSSIKCRPFDSMEYPKFDNPFEIEKFNKLYHVVSMKDIQLLELRWMLPPLDKEYRTQPETYLTWLIGHECKGSILLLLKEKGYAVGLNAWTDYYSMFSMLICSIELTEEGLANVEEVVHVVFQYISMLKRHGASKDIYDQIQQVNESSFNYIEIIEPFDYAEDLVENMLLYNEKDIISGPTLLREFNEKVIQEIQSMLTSDAVNIVLLSKHQAVECVEEEPWFKTKFRVTDIPQSWIDDQKCSKVNLDLHLPEQNRFIAERFELKLDQPFDFKYPKLIEENEYGKVWFKPDNMFLLPKAKIYFKLVSKILGNSSYHYACCHLMDEIIQYNMKELTYEADVALIELSSERDEYGNVLIFEGFNDKLQLFFQNVADEIASFTFTDKIFNIVKERIRKRTKNRLIKSHNLMRTLRLSVLQKLDRNTIDILKELSNITKEKLMTFAKEYFSSLYIESLFQGNITKEEALSYQSYICSSLKHAPLEKEEQPMGNTLKLPVGRTVCRHHGFNEKDPNSAIKIYYQVGPNSDRMFTVAKLLDHIMDEPVFDILRTQQQLGYTVYAEVHVTARILGFAITVISEVGKYDADYIDEKICGFFPIFLKKLQNLTKDEFDTYVESFIKNLQQINLTLNDEANRNWNEIARQDYRFDMNKIMVDYARTITKQDLIEFMNDYLLDEEKIRSLCIQVIGQSESKVENGHGSEYESDASSDSSDSESDSDDDDDDEDFDNDTYLDSHFELSLLSVTNKRYSNNITNLEKFKKHSEYYSNRIYNNENGIT